MKIANVFVVAAVISLATVGSTCAQNDNASYVVSYIEVMPSATLSTRKLLRALRDAGRKEAGNINFDVLERIDRRQHFVILETWRDTETQAAHASSKPARKLLDTLKPALVAPYDERLSSAFAAKSIDKPTRRSIYAVTHVDFVGTKKDEGLTAIRPLNDESIKQPGLQRYDVLQQSNKPNHLTLVEVWRSMAALEAHERADPSRKFREALRPIGGALYDQRLFRAID